MYNVSDVLLSDIEVASCFTVTLHVALRLEPSAVFAVMVVFPAETAVTKPEDETVATLGLRDDQVTDLLSALVGKTVADNCRLSPV